MAGQHGDFGLLETLGSTELSLELQDINMADQRAVSTVL
jgi:hypothetical protein